MKKNKLTKDVKVKSTPNDYSVKKQIEHEKKLGLDKNTGNWTNRILVGLPTTGLVRVETIMSKYSQIIPTNWSTVEATHQLSMSVPLEYQLPDAENLMMKTFVEGNYEYWISWEQDNVLPPNAYLRLNEYMIEGKVPIVSGLYFTKSAPAEPIVYRGRGNGSFQDFKMGDKIWADGIPLGFTLIHGSIIRALWNESEEYMVNNVATRKVFALPNFNSENLGFDNEQKEGQNRFAYTRGTTDLNMCKKIMRDDIFTKAGWPKYAKMKYPFLVDTNIFIQHIDERGRQYPLGGVPRKYMPIKGRKPRIIK